MKKITRRDLMKTTGMAGAAMMSAPALNVLGANEEIRVAVCGVNSQGFANAKTFRGIPGVKVVAFADPDSAVLAKRIKDFGGGIDGHKDYREVLDRKDVDVIVIATPNHWHSLMTIQACQAGKDVYVQKPVSHTMWEGTQLDKARQKYGCIVQAGTQNRSDVGLREFHQYVSEGNLGKLVKATGQCYRARQGIGKVSSPLKPPSTIDYNLWLGPAADLPMYRKNFHYDWHWIWNTGNGDFGNQGPHETDLLYWFLGNKTLPTSVTTFGGRFGWNDGGETPNMQFAAFEWGDVPVFFEVRDMAIKPEMKAGPSFNGIRTGISLEYEGGTFQGGRGGGWTYDKDGKKMKQFKGDGGGKHMANFIDAVRSRKQDSLQAPVDQAHRSASLFHMANISYNIGGNVSPELLKEAMSDNKECLASIERLGGQLEDWKIDLKKTPWTLGTPLKFNPKQFKFRGKGPLVEKANSMIKREYRKPFVVPEEV